MSAAPGPAAVHHLAHRADWEAACAAGGPYRPPGFEQDGFVHCSTAEQVAPTAARWFPPDADLVLLTLDVAALGDALRYEPGSLGEAALFPHVYGPVELDAVVRAEPYPRPG